MKQKFLLLAALAGGGNLGAQAQQLPNGGFEEGWIDCQPYTGKNNETHNVGQTPNSWRISHVSGAKLGKNWTGVTAVGENTKGHNSASAVLLTNTPNTAVSTVTVPSYISIGTTWSTSKMNKNNDGGTFGGIDFKNRPDAVEFYFKREAADDAVPATVVAYLWKGTWTQKAVPINIQAFLNPPKEDMIDRDVCVLGMDMKGRLGGDITSSADAKLIAKINQPITEVQTEWTKKTFEFEYTKESSGNIVEDAPAKLNIIFAANDYFNSSNTKANNKLYVDDVVLVYYHALKSFTYDGVTKEIAEGQTEINFSNTTYDANKTLSYIKKGVGANVEVKTYNEADATLTIEVQGNDFAKNPNSKTTYTVQFAKPVSTTGKLSSLKVNGAEVLKADQFYYTVYGEHTDNSITWTAEDGDLAEVTSTYDENKRTATVVVNARQNGQNTHTYFVKFAKEGTNYASKVLISMAGGFVGAPAQNVEITPLTENKTIDLQLMNFSLDGGQSFIGDIFVENVPYITDDAGNVVLKKELNQFAIFGDAAQDINAGITALNLNGTLTDKKLNATITITWMGMPIVVKVTPSDATSIDATGISGVDFEAVRTGLTNHNALIYADAEATGATDNDIVGGTCANLTITEGYAFHAPKAFTATKVSYDRVFKFGNDYVSSFVLPFAMHTTDVDGKVYKFNAVNGDNVNFTEVTGQLEANKPYLIVANSANPFSTALAKEVEIAATPETMVVKADNAQGFAHIGSYNTTEVTSDNITTYYGYTGGKFVKAKKGTLNPFRTLIKATGTTATQFSLKLDGEVTGIIGVNTELGKVDVYNLEGKLVRSQVEAATALQGLEKGVYVINGKKVMK